jgi:hypothetical protein
LPTSSLPAPETWAQKAREQKIRESFSQDGTLDAKGVAKRLREMGIFKKTMFISWASWCFNLSFLRDWLKDEDFSDVLPVDQNFCLLLQEYRVNLREIYSEKMPPHKPLGIWGSHGPRALKCAV